MKFKILKECLGLITEMKAGHKTQSDFVTTDHEAMQLQDCTCRTAVAVVEYANMVATISCCI